MIINSSLVQTSGSCKINAPFHRMVPEHFRMNKRLALQVLWLLLSMSMVVQSMDNGLARTPPMGWLSWERFLCNIDCKRDPNNCINEKLYKDMADRLAADGYRDAGYVYVNIDDCWMAKTRDANGRLQPDPERFPSGIKALADYVHSKGLKLGIYQDCGTKTCAGYPGSFGYFDTDAQTYAEWEVDMLKLDGCYAQPTDMDKIYPDMTKALNKTGRPMVFSCSWPDYQRATGMKPNYKTIAKFCNLWRNFDDIADSWTSVTSIIDYYAKVQDDLVPAAGPGNWNDPDMLIIGNFGLSVDQAKTQMAIWAILAAPLLMSNDLRDIKPEFKEILLNKDIIAINQDTMGAMGKKIYDQSQVSFWIRPVLPSKGNSSSYAVVVMNRRDMGSPVTVSAKLSSLGLKDAQGYNVYDLYQNKHFIGLFHPDDSIGVLVNPSGVVMLKAEVVS